MHSKLTVLACPQAGAACVGKNPPCLRSGAPKSAKAAGEFDLWFTLRSKSPGVSLERRRPVSFLALQVPQRQESVSRPGLTRNDSRVRRSRRRQEIFGFRRSRGNTARRNWPPYLGSPPKIFTTVRLESLYFCPKWLKTHFSIFRGRYDPGVTFL